MKITGTAWFNSEKSVGVVVVVDNHGDEYAYIKGIDGTNTEREDSIEIASWGAKFPLDVAKTLISRIGGETNIKY